MCPVQPAAATYAKLHIWQSVPAALAAPGDVANDKFQILPDNFFALFAIVASTNYDPFAGEWVGDNVDSNNSNLYGPARVPNNFSVDILQDNAKRFGGIQGQGIPQAVIGSNGYMAGHQLPYPVIYAPLTTFQFKFTNTAPVALKDNDDTPDPVSLQIRLGFYGYNVPNENLEIFMASWPAYQAEALRSRAGWLRKFTNMEI